MVSVDVAAAMQAPLREWWSARHENAHPSGVSTTHSMTMHGAPMEEIGPVQLDNQPGADNIGTVGMGRSAFHDATRGAVEVA